LGSFCVCAFARRYIGVGRDTFAVFAVLVHCG
jgi:hypothetical protein